MSYASTFLSLYFCINNTILNTDDIISMIIIKLKEQMERYRRTHGERLTLEKLADRTGLSKATLDAISSRLDYNTTLATLEKLCVALNCTPGDLLELNHKHEPTGSHAQAGGQG